MGGSTWNPWAPADDGEGRWACTRISEGCRYCYAATLAVRYGGTDYPWVEDMHGDHFAVPMELKKHKLLQPLHWKAPRMIFLSSMSDLFHAELPAEWLDEIFAVIALTQRHTYQVLTKRPGRMAAYLNDPATPGRVLDAHNAIQAERGLVEMRRRMVRRENRGGSETITVAIPDIQLSGLTWPLANVWLGASIESDAYRWRARDLLNCPATVRFLSCEPLLGPLDLLCQDYLKADPCTKYQYKDGVKYPCPMCKGTGWLTNLIDLVIVGGESGNAPGQPDRWLLEKCPGTDCNHPGCGQHDHCLDAGWEKHIGTGGPWRWKPERLGWVRRIKDTCDAAGIGFHFKQVGGPTNKSGGHLLDGETHQSLPRIASGV